MDWSKAHEFDPSNKWCGLLRLQMLDCEQAHDVQLLSMDWDRKFQTIKAAFGSCKSISGK